MKQSYNATAILDLIFEPSVAQYGTSSWVAGGDKFLVIPGQNGPRWIVPSPSSLGKIVLSQWQPYNFASKLKWKGLLLIYALGWLDKVPGIYFAHRGSGESLQVPKMIPSCVPVVYVGTPGPQQKAVVTLVSQNSGKPQAIMKVALGNRARSSLLREAVILEKLAGIGVTGVPSLLATEEDGERTWQSVITGKLTSRNLTHSHIEWLLGLPKIEKATTLQEQQELLRQELTSNIYLLQRHRRTASVSIAKMKGGQIPLVLVHGDFTPWNLKKQAGGKIAAIDWEDANMKGLPLWDLCHFFLMQAHLFKERNPIKRLASNALVQQYLMEMKLGKNEFVALVLSYILWTTCERNCSCSEAYREFLFAQIPVAIAI